MFTLMSAGAEVFLGFRPCKRFLPQLDNFQQLCFAAKHFDHRLQLKTIYLFYLLQKEKSSYFFFFYPHTIKIKSSLTLTVIKIQEKSATTALYYPLLTSGPISSSLNYQPEYNWTNQWQMRRKRCQLGSEFSCNENRNLLAGLLMISAAGWTQQFSQFH